jgi:hypothetical protein
MLREYVVIYGLPIPLLFLFLMEIFVVEGWRLIPPLPRIQFGYYDSTVSSLTTYSSF